MKKSYILTLLALSLGSQIGEAQSIQLDRKSGTNAYIMTSPDTVSVDYAAGFASVAVLANTDYNVTPKTDTDWLKFRKENNGNISVFSTYYNDATNPRFATLALTSADGSFTHNLVVKQQPNTSVNLLQGDTKVAISAMQASSVQSGYPISNAFDGNPSTIWHSNWNGGSFPFTVRLVLNSAPHVDYLDYTARSSGGNNGSWGNVTIYYATKDNPSKLIKAGTQDFGEKSGRFYFGENGIDNVYIVKIEINSAASDQGKNFASAAEIGLYQKNQEVTNLINTYFTSPLCNELRSDITDEQMAAIPVPYFRQLANHLRSGSYSTQFRVGTFGCYLDRNTLRNQLKTSSAYDPYENPTGIYFKQGDKVVVFAEGIDGSHPVQLCIKEFSNANDIETEGQPESYYSLTNGMNVITASNRGNGYINYYSDDFKNAPEVKLHFAMANEVGYFDQAKKMTNNDWKQMLTKAQKVGADNIDVLSNRLHVVVPVANALKVCPVNAEKLALLYDSIIYREREIMGLPQHGIEPKNHQFARPVRSGMFADGNGAAAAFGSFNEWCNPENMGFWGIGHELGHINQITPGFKWNGLGETTNNIYSAWVEHKLGAASAYGTGYHRLEDEYTGVNDYSGMRGGRFQVYLEEGVRKGISWQLQDGPDYFGSEPSTEMIADVDENGKATGKTVVSNRRNYDHFVKVVPFWQLELFALEAGKAPNAWSDFIQTYRDGFDQTKFNTNGKQQMEMIRRFCDAVKLNLCSFFEKAGMLRPIHAYIEDYSRAWTVITQDMCDNLKAEIAAKGYPEAPAGLNFINAYNFKRFRDEVKLTTGTLGKGCVLQAANNRVQVDNNAWPGAVGYETYNAKGELLRVTMFGLGDSQRSDRYTYVLFPSSESAKYIMAVGYDGTRVKIYQK